jgi:class 3 adenylate cyclase
MEDAIVRCPACDADCRQAARFCEQCGSRLPSRPESQRSVASSAMADPAARDEPGGDRRIVTALFADLVDYVRMLAEHDAEDVKRRVDAALAAMDAAVVRFGGRREKFIGDAIFAVFGHPTSHGDDAVRAGLAALAIRAALSEVAIPGEEPLAVRIGLATGEVVAAPRALPGLTDVSLTGPAVVIAARVQSLAQPGEILTDDATVRAARGRLLAEDRGLHRLRGQSAAVRLYAIRGDVVLLAEGPAAGRLIGRAPDRERLRQLIEASGSSGRGGVAVVVGEAGIGKSRLLADLAPDAEAAGLKWTWTENVSYGTGEPYRFVRAFAQAVAHEEATDSGSLARQLMFSGDLDPEAAIRIRGAVAAMARDAEFSGWEAEAPLAPTDPALLTAAILEAGRRYTARMAEVLGPRVIVIDDLHWADRSSLPALDQLTEMAPSLGFVMLFGSRPGPLPAWLEREGVLRIDLAGLDPAETGQLAAEVAGTALVPDDARAVHDRTGGNPLFVGETVRALLEDGSLALRHGQFELVASPSSRDMPVTLRALLEARIDALSQASREVLRVASVVGMAFSTAVVEDLLGQPPRPTALSGLVRASLIVGGDGGAAPWRFAHPLIRDAAYAGLLASRRRVLHGRLADYLEARPRRTIGPIARHRAAAGDAERAVPLLDRAARDALRLGALPEAAEYWRMAAELLAPDDPRALPFREAAERATAESDSDPRPVAGTTEPLEELVEPDLALSAPAARAQDAGTMSR